MTPEVEASTLKWSQDYQLPNLKYVSLQARLIWSAPKILSILSCLALSNLSAIGVALGIDPYNHFGAPPPPANSFSNHLNLRKLSSIPIPPITASNTLSSCALLSTHNSTTLPTNLLGTHTTPSSSPTIISSGWTHSSSLNCTGVLISDARVKEEAPRIDGSRANSWCVQAC